MQGRVGKIRGLWASTKGGQVSIGQASVSMTMMGDIPRCVISPVVGNAPIANKKVESDILRKFPVGSPCDVVMDWGGTRITLFSGIVAHIGFDNFRGSYSADGSYVPIVTIVHSVVTLSSVVLNTVMFSPAGVSYEQFTGDQAPALWLERPFITRALASKRLAVHVRDILHLIAEWYQRVAKGGGSANIKQLVKATSVTMKDVLPADDGYLSDTVARGTEATITRAVEGRQTYLQILEALSQFCLLSIVPRLKDVVLVPDSAGYKKPSHTPTLSRKYVVRMKYDKTRQSVPISRVVVNATQTYMWDSLSKGEPSGGVSLSGGSYTGSFYPPMKSDSTFTTAVQVSPPPILSGLLLKSVYMSGDDSPKLDINTIPTGMREGMGEYDQSGGSAVEQAPEEAKTLGDQVAKMMYGAVAYAGSGMGVEVVFDGLLEYSNMGAQWSDRSIYSLLGQVIGVEAPDPASDSKTLQSLVGYVTGVSIDVNIRASALKCELGVSNVRAKEDDDKHSLLLSENPLYNGAGTAGVE